MRTLFAFALVMGCSKDDEPKQAEPAPLEFVNGFAEGDAERPGQEMFLYETWGAEVIGEWPPADFMLALMEDEPDVFGDQFADFGFLEDPTDDFPIGFKRGPVDGSRVNHTCAICHVGATEDGELVLGAPNVDLDFGRFQVEVNARWTAAGNPSLLSAIGEERAAELGPGRARADSSDWPNTIPSDFPPYLQLADRAAINYAGSSADVRSEAYLAIFTFGPGHPDNPEVPFPDAERVDTFVEFLGAMQPPEPPEQDADEVAAGEAVFTSAGCTGCHQPDDPASEQIVPVDVVGTDPERHALLGGEDDGEGFDEGYIDFIAFIVENGLLVGQTDGYRVGYLRGLAMSAPYLHNGSVPTLEDLLSPASERPKSWDRNGFTVDATLPANSNAGHEYGTDLSKGDRDALIAYLLSL